MTIDESIFKSSPSSAILNSIMLFSVEFVSVQTLTSLMGKKFSCSLV